jgi:hypothetical protein
MATKDKEGDKVPFPVAVVGSLPLAGPEIRGRWVFLEALQIECPEFWRELREIEKQNSKEAVASWMIRSGVTDPWFIQIIWDTVDFWAKSPGSTASLLESGRNWFYYAVAQDALSDEGTFQLPPFQPIFFHTDYQSIHPVPFTPDGRPERLESFQRRMKREFNAQLALYVEYIRSLTGERLQYEPHHATWTARAFTGHSFIDIGFNSVQARRHDRPDKAVRTAVIRFAERIGLRLPSEACAN